MNVVLSHVHEWENKKTISNNAFSFPCEKNIFYYSDIYFSNNIFLNVCNMVLPLYISQKTQIFQIYNLCFPVTFM